jgi:carbonic anhydrase
MKNDPTVQEIPFGELMSEIDTNNRWVYKGSLTTPPCTKLIYWNVVSTVYPIKEKHLNLFRN